MNKEIKHTRSRGASTYDFTVPKDEVKGREIWEIQMELGYHPAGYGAPFDIREDDKNVYFSCWNNCD